MGSRAGGGEREGRQDVTVAPSHLHVLYYRFHAHRARRGGRNQGLQLQGEGVLRAEGKLRATTLGGAASESVPVQVRYTVPMQQIAALVSLSGHCEQHIRVSQSKRMELRKKKSSISIEKVFRFPIKKIM